MNTIDYRQLAALQAVVREGSFEAAARALHLTPSALSQRIKALEQRVGGVLLTRERPSRITALGQPLLRHAQQVALLEADLSAQWGGRSKSADAPPPQRLAVAVNADSLATWFVAAVAPALADGRLLLDLQVDDEELTRERLRRGEVLAAVSARATPVQGCRSTPLGALSYRATASPAFVARWFAQGVRPTALAQAPSLRYSAHDALQTRWLRRQLKGRSAEPPAHEVPSSIGFVRACEAGLGWGLNPEALVADALRDGRLVEIGPPLLQPLHWHCSRLPSQALQRLTAAVLSARLDGLRPVPR